jgi:hypothetical protein
MDVVYGYCELDARGVWARRMDEDCVWEGREHHCFTYLPYLPCTARSLKGRENGATYLTYLGGLTYLR